MTIRLLRSINVPIRDGLSWTEMWRGSDNGLIYCWEKGRKTRANDHELAGRAEKGELVSLGWKGGITTKLQTGSKRGTLRYLATWQGLRGEDLDLALDKERIIKCSKTGQIVVFSSKLILDDE
jgi:hypothetical protein